MRWGRQGCFQRRLIPDREKREIANVSLVVFDVVPATRIKIDDYRCHICWNSSIINKLASRVRRLFSYTRQIYRVFDALLGPNLASTVVRSPYRDGRD